MSENKLHDNSRHNNPYDFDKLSTANKNLKDFITKNKNGQDSIDFGNQIAVRELNKAILMAHYDIKYWDFPDEALCPAVPGRAEYLHHIADLLSKDTHRNQAPKGDKVSILDIGTGATLIYPLIGHQQYGWSFVGSEINPTSYVSAQKIITENKFTENQIKVIKQEDTAHIFRNVIDDKLLFDAVVCNPPFHRSKAEAEEHTKRKWLNLGHTKSKRYLNFGGQSSELWYPGGERSFIQGMVRESSDFKKQVLWFTSLVSKKENISHIMHAAEKSQAEEAIEIELVIGNKNSRVICWTFWKEKDRKKWGDYRWTK